MVRTGDLRASCHVPEMREVIFMGPRQTVSTGARVGQRAVVRTGPSDKVTCRCGDRGQRPASTASSTKTSVMRCGFPFRRVVQGHDRVLIIGPDRSGRLLEVVVIDPDDDPAVIHAMPLRRKLYDYL